MNALCRVYYVNEPIDIHRCEILLENNELMVQYVDYDYDGADVLMKYRGKEKGQGHFSLYEDKFKYRATLHTIDWVIFEGSYYERDSQKKPIEGMWQIVCNKPLRKVI